MPDRRVITVDAHTRMTCPELLFQPSLWHKTFYLKSIQAIAWESISASDVDVRNELLKNIILSGGSSMNEYLPDRLKTEIKALASASTEVKVVATADRKYAVWKGGSVLAS